jgi:hypothetical protein
VQYRKVMGEERDRLLRSRKPAGFNYHAYNEVLSGLSDGDVVAITIDDANAQRGEKIRFARAARQVGKSLTWLGGTESDEIAFQVGPQKQKRTREKRV